MTSTCKCDGDGWVCEEHGVAEPKGDRCGCYMPCPCNPAGLMSRGAIVIAQTDSNRIRHERHGRKLGWQS